MPRNVLLISNSTCHGEPYLGHCEAYVKPFFTDLGAHNILFVPFALADHDKYTATAKRAFEAMGFSLTGLHEAADPKAAVQAAQGIFIGGGNTFRLLATLQRLDVLDDIREAVLTRSIPYMGTSAGCNVACPTICTTNDMPIVQPQSFCALDLVPFQVNAHFLTDAAHPAGFMGETRSKRLAEFHEENGTHVMALPEGAALLVQGDAMTCLGREPVYCLQPGGVSQEFAPGTEITHVLTAAAEAPRPVACSADV